jgi:hypothetical protein
VEAFDESIGRGMIREVNTTEFGQGVEELRLELMSLVGGDGLRATETGHPTVQEGQASLHLQRGRLQEHRLQPCGHSKASHATTSDHIIAASSTKNYTFRSSRSLPSTLKQK